MRLTKKRESNYPSSYEWNQHFLAHEPLYKLGQLEDIEEELGIDLITLFNVLKDKKVWVVYAERISRFYITDIDIKKGVITGDISIGKSACFEKTYNIKDYDQTWALTKDELL